MTVKQGGEMVTTVAPNPAIEALKRLKPLDGLVTELAYNAAIKKAQEVRGGWKDASWVNEHQDWSHTAKKAAEKAKTRDPKY